MSAIGAVPVDLDGVLLASGASGKALGAFPGLSMVFYAGNVRPEPARLPRYLDLGYYAQKDGVPFTHSSNLVAALDAALARFDDPVAVQAIGRDVALVQVPAAEPREFRCWSMVRRRRRPS